MCTNYEINILIKQAKRLKRLAKFLCDVSGIVCTLIIEKKHNAPFCIADYLTGKHFVLKIGKKRTI